MVINIKKITVCVFSFIIVLQSYSKVLFSQDSIYQVFIFYSLITFALMIFFSSRFDLADIFIIGLSFIAYILLGNGFALKLVLVSLALRYCNIDVFLRFYLYLACLIFIFVIVFGTAETTDVFYKGEGTLKTIRETLGFDNPNKAFYYITPIITCLLFLYYKRYPFCSLIIIVAITYFIFTKTLTTTGLLSNLILVILLLLYRLFPRISERILSNTALVPILIILLTSVSFSLAYFYHSNDYVNSLLSLRPLFWYEVLNAGYVELIFMGQLYDTHNIPLDNSYIQAVYYMGLFFFLIMIYCYWLGLSIAKKNGNSISLITILIIYTTIYSFGETFFIEPTLNLTFIIVFNFIWTLKRYESINL